jgi:hypothetical protein
VAVAAVLAGLLLLLRETVQAQAVRVAPAALRVDRLPRNLARDRAKGREAHREQ